MSKKLFEINDNNKMIRYMSDVNLWSASEYRRLRKVVNNSNIVSNPLMKYIILDIVNRLIPDYETILGVYWDRSDSTMSNFLTVIEHKLIILKDIEQKCKANNMSAIGKI